MLLVQSIGGLTNTPYQPHQFRYKSELLDINNLYQAASDEIRAIVAFLLSGNATEPDWVDHDVRAYIAAMEMKVGKYLKALESERKSQNITKTGT